MRTRTGGVRCCGPLVNRWGEMRLRAANWDCWTPRPGFRSRIERIHGAKSAFRSTDASVGVQGEAPVSLQKGARVLGVGRGWTMFDPVVFLMALHFKARRRRRRRRFDLPDRVFRSSRGASPGARRWMGGLHARLRPIDFGNLWKTRLNWIGCKGGPCPGQRFEQRTGRVVRVGVRHDLPTDRGRGARNAKKGRKRSPGSDRSNRLVSFIHLGSFAVLWLSPLRMFRPSA